MTAMPCYYCGVPADGQIVVTAEGYADAIEIQVCKAHKQQAHETIDDALNGTGIKDNREWKKPRTMNPKKNKDQRRRERIHRAMGVKRPDYDRNPDVEVNKVSNSDEANQTPQAGEIIKEG